jgi:acyl-CoA synthetase (AMP-forming)/AMP-acid ligase II
VRGPPAPAPRHPTLAHALLAAASHPSGVTFVDLREREVRLGWDEVVRRARAAAARLRAWGVAPGDRVAILLRTEPAFLDAFFGAWLAGAVPVPLYPPVRLGRLDEYLAATTRLLVVSGARLVLSGGGTLGLLGQVVERASPALGCRDVAALLAGPAPSGQPPLDDGQLAPPGALGLIQFSSGSTVDPKPVALTHAALQAQADALQTLVEPGADDVLVSWLPLYHDMGLLGGLLGAMSYPGPLVLIPPEHFLARPALWLRAVARHRGTISPAPSFAYAYCADRVTDADLAGLHLRSWRLALDGAEPISGEVLRRFAARFAPHGFDPGSLLPVYGLSEAALAVTFAARGAPLEGRRLDAVRLARDGLVVSGDREVMPVGTPVPGVEVEVRGRRGAPLGEDRLGRIWVRGPSLFAGYVGDPTGTARALVDGWLDTGDLGFWSGGQLHVHGRSKDLVIIRGANHAPEEFEEALAGLEGLRPGCAVALGRTAEDGGEALLLLAERLRGRSAGGDAALEEAIRHRVLARTGIAPAEVRLLEPGTLPRTSSGKLRRREALRRWQEEALTAPRPAGPLVLALAAIRSRLALGRAGRARVAP